MFLVFTALNDAYAGYSTPDTKLKVNKIHVSRSLKHKFKFSASFPEQNPSLQWLTVIFVAWYCFNHYSCILINILSYYNHSPWHVQLPLTTIWAKQRSCYWLFEWRDTVRHSVIRQCCCYAELWEYWSLQQCSDRTIHTIKHMVLSQRFCSKLCHLQ